MADGDEQQKQKQSAPQEGGWQYKSGGGATAEPDPFTATPMNLEAPRVDSVEWTASEFVAHEKGFGWYAALAAVSLVIAAVIYLVTRDVFAVVVVLVMAIFFGVAGSRKPQVITYRVDNSGLTAGNKFYPYAAYKSFTMPQDGPFTAITLVPLKRVAFPVGAYLAPDSQEKVLDIISAHLPMERGEPGAVDRLMRQLRF